MHNLRKISESPQNLWTCPRHVRVPRHKHPQRSPEGDVRRQGPPNVKDGVCRFQVWGGGLPVAPVAIAEGDSGNLGTRDPPSSTPFPEQAGDNGPNIATLVQQNQEMMRLFLLSQAATPPLAPSTTAVLPPPMAPSTTTSAPVVVAPAAVVAPHDGGESGGGGGEVDGGEFSRAATCTTQEVLPRSLTDLGRSVEDGLLGSVSGRVGAVYAES